MSSTQNDSHLIRTILFDVGGVLGTNGWDHNQRAAACLQFGIDREAYEARHEEVVGAWERGNMTMDEYLDITVFERPRAFTRGAFREFMFAQSKPRPAMLQLAAALARTGVYTMMTMNNESAELNAHRIRTFGLRDLFSAFLSSCYLGTRKPWGDFYDRALAISQADAATTVFIDDREENLAPVRERGVHTLQAMDEPSVRAGLAQLGVTTPTQ